MTRPSVKRSRLIGLGFDLEAVGAEGSELPASAWPGGYPLLYLTEDAETLCAECASKQLASNRSDLAAYLASVESITDLAYWRVGVSDTVAGWLVHWEGPSDYCAACSVEIPSAYGDPEASESE